jgi:hypothetical protein
MVNAAKQRYLWNPRLDAAVTALQNWALNFEAYPDMERIRTILADEASSTAINSDLKSEFRKTLLEIAEGGPKTTGKGWDRSILRLCCGRVL